MGLLPDIHIPPEEGSPELKPKQIPCEPCCQLAIVAGMLLGAHQEKTSLLDEFLAGEKTLRQIGTELKATPELMEELASRVNLDLKFTDCE